MKLCLLLLWLMGLTCNCFVRGESTHVVVPVNKKVIEMKQKSTGHDTKENRIHISKLK